MNPATIGMASELGASELGAAPLMGRAAATAAAVLLAVLALFELALAAGLPWGRAAWGGQQAQLGPGLRVASVVAAAALVAAALIVLRRAGLTAWTPLPSGWVGTATWVLVAYFSLGALMNLVSRSLVERAVMTPAALALAVLCGLVATHPAS